MTTAKFTRIDLRNGGFIAFGDRRVTINTSPTGYNGELLTPKAIGLLALTALELGGSIVGAACAAAGFRFNHDGTDEMFARVVAANWAEDWSVPWDEWDAFIAGTPDGQQLNDLITAELAPDPTAPLF